MSLRARAYLAALRLRGRKAMFADLDAFHASIVASQAPGLAEPPAPVRRELSVLLRQVRGWPCYLLAPHAPVSSRRVLYLHGGAYVHQIETDHWHFLARLVQRTGCTVAVPIYPLAPSHTVADTVPVVLAAYEEFLAGHDPGDQIVMGDSAGGALALVVAEELEAAGRPQPKELVLLAPWLDVTMTDPAAPEYDRHDPYLAIPGLREAGRLYAGDHDPRDPVVSPIYGPLSALDRVSVFVGTRDVLLADARRLAGLARAKGISLEYWEYPEMFHAWMITRIPEARDAERRIARLLTRQRVPATESST